MEIKYRAARIDILMGRVSNTWVGHSLGGILNDNGNGNLPSPYLYPYLDPGGSRHKVGVVKGENGH